MEKLVMESPTSVRRGNVECGRVALVVGPLVADSFEADPSLTLQPDNIARMAEATRAVLHIDDGAATQRLAAPRNPHPTDATSSRHSADVNST